MKVILVDANSIVRVKLETEKPQDFIRGMLNISSVPTNSQFIKIWIWDGKGGNQRRRDLFPNYKNRPPKSPDIMRNMNFVRELIGLTASWQAQVPGYEGDDVIAALAEHFLKTTDLPVEIDTRDGDLVALRCLDPKRVSCTFSPKVVIPPDLVRLYKTFVGDSSDTIPGLKGFGDGAWEKADKAALQNLLDHICKVDHEWGETEANRALAAGMSKTSANWLLERENRDQLAIMKRIIDPMPIDPKLLDEHITMGTNDQAAIMAKLKEYMM